jgi:polyphosphate kinase
VAETQLCYPSFIPAKIAYENIFERIKTGDFLAHLPYQSFQPTVDFITGASRDPQVLGIKMNLYRTNSDSAIIRALKEAAAGKKQVTVLVEIKARFDEENNINWARELEEAGCHVIYGIPTMKTHCKMALVVRQEEDRIRRYVHLSTGNYNEKTSRVYTDIGYFTSNEDFAKDISDMFNVLSGYSMPSRWKRIIAAPHDMRDYFFDMIDAEIACQEKTKNGLITAKMNALEDTQMIEKLYEASCKGVKVRLLVRGICCLIPGVKGLSENIEVRSLVGRFLEHSRLYIFNSNGERRIFLSSADWMTRNLSRRVELLFEITKEELKDHLQFIMETYWKDTAKTRVLKNDATYARLPDPAMAFNAQEFLITHYTGSP